MSDVNRFSNSSGEADWDAIARAMADDGAPEEREALRGHLAGHPERAGLVDALDEAARRMAAEAHASVDVEGALASVLARRDAAETPVIPFRARRAAPPARRWRAPAWSAAAMILLAIGAALVWRSADRAPAAEYAAEAGAGRELRLADGTRVRLGGSSVLTVAAGYGGAAREVAARGDAYFEVVHDERSPFIVRTHDAVVHDLGTAFTVRADSGAGTRVVVTSGVVTLAVPGGRPDTLRAGDRGRTHSAGVLVERGAATGDDVAWTRGEIVFRDVPLATAAAELRRWYGVPVVVTDPTLARRRVTATFDSAQTLDEVLGVLAATVGGRVERRGGRVFISRAAAP
jgi:transmembrane sensor